MQYRLVLAAAMAASSLALLAAPASAVPALTGASVQIAPTLETAGLRFFTLGDDNANTTATVQYRATGASTWSAGHPLVRYAANRLGSMLLNLREGTSYDVLITPTDPDGALAPLLTTFVTRATPRTTTAGRTLYVSNGGGSNGTGSPTAPFGSITAAVNAAKPGDTILLLKGIYRERVINVSVSGTPAAPITIKPAGPGVRMEGDAANLETAHTTALWTPQADGTWTAAVAGPSCYAAANGTRLYHYTSLAALEQAVAAGAKGWWQNPTTNVVYASIGAGLSPDKTAMEVSQIRNGFHFEDVHDIILDGLDMGYYGSDYGQCVYLKECSNITVRNCQLHNTTDPVALNNSSQCLVELNNIRDVGLESLTWAAIKGTDAEGIGVSVANGGSGNVVRLNQIHNIFNGVYVSTGTLDTQGDTDVYYNYIHDIGDDALEPEEGNINTRFWSNTIRTCQNALSLAPIGSGPLWAMYNVLSEFREAALKVSDDTTGQVRVYHNTMVTTQPGVDGLTPWSPMSNIMLRNNIICGTRYVIEDYYTDVNDACSMDNDVLFTTDPTRFVKWSDVAYGSVAGLSAATGEERNGLKADPSFVAGNGGDFRLLSASPARHRAVLIPGINDFFGFLADVGAYQMG